MYIQREEVKNGEREKTKLGSINYMVLLCKARIAPQSLENWLLYSLPWSQKAFPWGVSETVERMGWVAELWFWIQFSIAVRHPKEYPHLDNLHDVAKWRERFRTTKLQNGKTKDAECQQLLPKCEGSLLVVASVLVAHFKTLSSLCRQPSRRVGSCRWAEGRTRLYFTFLIWSPALQAEVTHWPHRCNIAEPKWPTVQCKIRCVLYITVVKT